MQVSREDPVADELQQAIREHLHGAALPPAPATLREGIEHLRSMDPPTPARRMRPPLLMVAAALTTVAIGAAALGLAGSTYPVPAPSRDVTAPSPGITEFGRAGFMFEIPRGWSDLSAGASNPVMPEERFVGYFVKSGGSCPAASGGLAPTSSACERAAAGPGNAALAITELEDQYPWLPAALGAATTIGGYPAASRRGDAETDWFIQSPDGGIYDLALTSPTAEMAANVADISQALDSIRLSSWEVPPTIVDRQIHQDQHSFTFDYPAGWVRYYPTDFSSVDVAIVTVASSPLLPPCSTAARPVDSGAPPVSACGTFATPPGTIAVAFRIASGPTSPDWSKAQTRIGGQPAIELDAGTVNTTTDEERHVWSVRLPGQRSALEVEASLRGPGVRDLRAAMARLLQSVTLP
jgi:hypothetical protein